MYRDQLTKTIRNLNLKFEGLSELLEDRNLLLKVLMGKEMREDFLLSERLQSLDEVGGYDVKAMTRNADLSPVNEMMPPLNIGQSEDDEGEVPFKKGGAVGIQPIVDISAESLGTEPSPAGESYQSLEDSNALVPLDKAAETIVEDFEVDKKFKKAFETAMMLPSKAAAASLMDTMSKTPSQGEGTTIIKKNLSVLQSAFKLPTPEPTEDETKSESEQLDPEELKKKRDDWADNEEKEKEKDKDRSPFELGVKFLMTKAFSFMANKKAGGAIAPSVATGDPLIPDFFTAPGYMPGYIGDGEENKGGFWNRIKSGAKKAFDMTPMGMGVKMLGAAKDKFKNVMQNDKVKGFLGGVGNFAKKAFKYTPLGMAVGAGTSIINRIRGGDQTNLNELTENVIAEQEAKVQEEKNLALNPVTQNLRDPAPVPMNTGSGSMDQGGGDAIPKIKYSPYFDEYTVTSQF
jgi:hypothetical protein